MTRKPLGRGLSALIGTDSQQPDSEEVQEIEIDLVRPSRQQPRTSFNEAKLEELAQSIRVSGIIQPLLLRPSGGLFELVAGERRWRAAQLAGLTHIPAIVRDIPDHKLLELALIENIQRQELNPIEEANAYKRLLETLGLTQDEVARRVGRDRTFITNYLRILKLPQEIQSLLEQEKLSFGHARALLGVTDAHLQRRLAQRIFKNYWSVRETERRVRQMTQDRKRITPTITDTADPNIRFAETKLRRSLATQVRIVSPQRGTPGRIEIEYYSEADLNRIYELIVSQKDKITASAGAGL